MIGSLAFDHFGFLGVTEQHVTLPRLFGVTMIIAGVGLTRF
jgi:bacterial/archaeal transporter family-2 protein